MLLQLVCSLTFIVPFCLGGLKFSRQNGEGKWWRSTQGLELPGKAGFTPESIITVRLGLA